VADSDRDRAYPERASAAQRGELTGSSAGGEQPKFLTTVRRGNGVLQSVLVKFSAADPSPVSVRWADLLACEHLAAEAIRDRKIRSARTEVIDAGGRRFLEVERFDRAGAAGRRGVLTLSAIENAFLERSSADWTAAAAMLEQAHWIAQDEARTLRWVWCFGDLIANTDMHGANVGFWFADALPYQLAPFYDMLPMLYAPGAQGDLGERAFVPRPPLAGVADVWSEAASAALEFWGRVGAETRVSAPFRDIAGDNHAVIARLLQRFG
jgi:serine/threonine protein kinase HipA of HipAB toxin-antitoxin module